MQYYQSKEGQKKKIQGIGYTMKHCQDNNQQVKKIWHISNNWMSV